MLHPAFDTLLGVFASCERREVLFYEISMEIQRAGEEGLDHFDHPAVHFIEGFIIIINMLRS